MAASFVGTTQTSVTGTSLNLAFPNTAVGDIVFLSAYVNEDVAGLILGFNNNDVVPFYPLFEVRVDVGTHKGHWIVWWRRVDGTEPSTLNWVKSNSSLFTVQHVQYTGCYAVGQPFQYKPSTVISAVDHIAPSVNSIFSNGLQVFLGCEGALGSWSTPTGFTEDYDGGASYPFSVSHKALSATGATGTTTSTGTADGGFAATFLLFEAVPTPANVTFRLPVSGGSTSSLADWASPSINVTAGDGILIYTANLGNAVPTSVTDGPGNTYDAIPAGANSRYDANDDITIAQWFCKNALTTAAITPTAHWAAAHTNVAIAVFPCLGQDHTIAPTGKIGADQAATGVTDAITTGSFSPGTAPGMLIACAFNGYGNYCAAGTGFDVVAWDLLDWLNKESLGTIVEQASYTTTSSTALTFTNTVGTGHTVALAMAIPAASGQSQAPRSMQQKRFRSA